MMMAMRQRLQCLKNGIWAEKLWNERKKLQRNVDINEISDGKLYGLNDMVKVGCNDCEGCSKCCQGMGDSIKLDPLDIYNLTINLSVSFQELLEDKGELNVVDGMILPNLKLSGDGESCNFLNKEGRCSVHSFRPGICRLFPLGRIYNETGFDYFLQVNECVKPNKTKVKVKKWIDTADVKKNESYIIKWHTFIKYVQGIVESNTDEALIKQINMAVLQVMFVRPYAKDDFYGQFEERICTLEKALEEI